MISFGAVEKNGGAVVGEIAFYRGVSGFQKAPAKESLATIVIKKKLGFSGWEQGVQGL
jgi:hypothetical protein